ncbi:MAG TPA: branched-chain amino acid ABC transporter permease, partial [bacterium]|nr:branched-chain amino acid ABC transporter permease [bacterium]
LTPVTFYVLQGLNGLAYGMLLFLMAAGLSLIFGLMEVINLAHGAFYMLGAYLALSMVRWTGSFWIAALTAPLVLGAAGFLLEWEFLRPLYRRTHLDQILLTFGFAFVLSDLARWLWGADVQSLAPPPGLDRSIPMLGTLFPAYRLFVILLGTVLAGGLWLGLNRTRLGAMVRAGVADKEMTQALGIDIGLVFTGVFAFGTALAGLAGVIAAPIQGVFPGVDFEILIVTLIVVVVGGLGTLGGSFWGSLLIGEVDTFGKTLVPQAALVFIYLIMAAILLVRPVGLFGGRSR